MRRVIDGLLYESEDLSNWTRVTEPVPPRGHWEWPKPEPCGPLSDPNRSHIYRAPRWVEDAPRIYR